MMEQTTVLSDNLTLEHADNLSLEHADNLSLEHALDSLINSEALEVYIEENQVSIPYMMNDAVECYFVLHDCKTIGEWEFDLADECTYSMHEKSESGRYGLFISQGNKNTVSIWYTSSERKLKLYQYHEIGHFWVKGNELMRRLVYIVGTIHDKYMYLGEEYCNEAELGLLYLMEFAPFRYFSPISESLDAYYINSENGLQAAKAIAEKLADANFTRVVQKYEKLYRKTLRNNKNEVCSDNERTRVRFALNQKKVQKLGEALLECQAFYDYVVAQINKASLEYDKREYDFDETKQMELMRKAMMEEYTRLGFEGSYPVLTKGDRKIHFYEEHPYVARDFEYKDYEFSIKAIEEWIAK